MSVFEKISAIIFLMNKYEQKNILDPSVFMYKYWNVGNQAVAKCGQISKFMVLYPTPSKNGKNMHFWAKNDHFCTIWPPWLLKKHFFDTSCVCIET